MPLIPPCLLLLGAQLVIGQVNSQVTSPDWLQHHHQSAPSSIHGFPPEFLEHVANPQGLITSGDSDNNADVITYDDYDGVEAYNNDYSEFSNEPKVTFFGIFIPLHIE